MWPFKYFLDFKIDFHVILELYLSFLMFKLHTRLKGVLYLKCIANGSHKKIKCSAELKSLMGEIVRVN
jgi:hypothetical protein